MRPTYKQSLEAFSVVLLAGACLSPGSGRERSDHVLVEGLSEPKGIATGARGRFVVADAGTHQVVVFDARGEELARFGESLLEEPLGIAVDADGSILVSDELANHVHRFDPSGRLLQSFGETGDGPGQFSGAGPLDVAPDGTIYVVDVDHDRIQAFDRSGGFLFAFGKKGRFGDSSPGELYFPGGLAVDVEGRIYVSDTHDFRIQRFSSQGKVERVWGHQGTWIGEFDHPFGLAIDDGRGLVYVADDHVKLEGGGNRIRVFSLAGEPQSELGHGDLEHPFDVAIGPGGRILVSERGAGRIKSFAPGAPSENP